MKKTYTIGKQLLQWIGWMAAFTLLAFGIYFLFPNRISTAALKGFQCIQTIGTFLIPAVLVAFLWSEQPMKWLRLDARVPGLTYTMAVLLMVMALPAINLIGTWNEQLHLPSFLSGIEQWMQQQEEAAALLTERFLRVQGAGALVVNIGLMALLPAVAEELSFRGVLNNICAGTQPSTLRQHVAIWVTAIVFSAIHFQFYGFIPRMLLGALFGYMVWWTGSLRVSMLMHFINNGVAVVAYYYVYNHGIDPNTLETLGTGNTLWLGITSLVLTIVGVYIFLRSRTMSNASSRIS